MGETSTTLREPEPTPMIGIPELALLVGKTPDSLRSRMRTDPELKRYFVRIGGIWATQTASVPPIREMVQRRKPYTRRAVVR